jgi:hypothetical protein
MHIISCAQNTNRVIIDDTFNAMNANAEKELNKLETLNEKYGNNTYNVNTLKLEDMQTIKNPIDDLQKKYYSVKSVKNKKPPKKMSFETKIIKFRNALQMRKIDWRDAFCKIEINRENILEESIKKFKLIDPMKVYFSPKQLFKN